MMYKSHIFDWGDLLNTEKLFLDSEISLKNMPDYVVSYGGSFTKSLCRPSAFNQREYVTTDICKPHIFRRADLFNTEIIITSFQNHLYNRLKVSLLMKAMLHYLLPAYILQ